MIARVTMHRAKETKLEEAKAFITATTETGKEMGGVVARYSMQSRTGLLKFVNVTFWKDKETLDKFIKTRMAQATGSDSLWEWIDGYEYDVNQVV